MGLGVFMNIIAFVDQIVRLAIWSVYFWLCFLLLLFYDQKKNAYSKAAVDYAFVSLVS